MLLLWCRGVLLLHSRWVVGGGGVGVVMMLLVLVICYCHCSNGGCGSGSDVAGRGSCRRFCWVVVGVDSLCL